MEKTDAELVADYISGDESALLLLIERHVRPVYNFIYRFTGNRQDTDDITQEGFVKMWKKINTYKPDKKIRTWLFSIARNASIDWLRKKKNFVFSDFEREDENDSFIENLTDPTPLPEELIEQAEKTNLLSHVLMQLPPFYREVLLLKYYQHFTFEEISKILEKSMNTVKSQHRRGLLLLLKLLDAPKKEQVS